MKRIGLVILASILMVGCAHQVVYVMPDPPRELMAPPAKLESIKPGVVTPPIKPPT